MDNEVSESLNICHINCQSLMAHFDEFRAYFEGSKYHVICLSETWLKTSISDSLVSLHGYQVFRCNRMGKNGGGVALYVSSSFRVRVLCQSEGPYVGRPEFLIAEISTYDTSKILLAVVYRPPHCGYLPDFFDAFMDLSVGYRHLIILGDFNADLGVTSFDSAQILTFVESMNLHLVPFAPTHHTRTASTYLDLCIVDDADKLLSHEQKDASFLSAHDLIGVNYKVQIERLLRRPILILYVIFALFALIAFWAIWICATGTTFTKRTISTTRLHY